MSPSHWTSSYIHSCVFFVYGSEAPGHLAHYYVHDVFGVRPEISLGYR